MNYKSTGMDCEIITRKKWAGKEADMVFTTVKSHSDEKYTVEAPYKSSVIVDEGYGFEGKNFVLSFSVTACEYDNFKYITIDTDSGAHRLQFNENGEIYFNDENTLQSYPVDKWMQIELYFGDGAAVKIDGEFCAKINVKVTKVNSVALDMTGYPTYGPILQSSIGICDIKYRQEDFDFKEIGVKDTEYLLLAEHSPEAVLDAITVNHLAPLDKSKRIRHSLNFIDSGYEDITVKYTSGDERYITKSGRVIRPKAGEDDVQVAVTAEVSDGSSTLKKIFDFEVLADETAKDPCYMPDEEFFGRFSDGAWVIEGKLNYSCMPQVENAVKSGDYKGAKTALLEYYRQKPRLAVKQKEITEFDEGYADMLLDNFHQLQQGYYMGSFISGDSFAKISPEWIKENGSIAISVRVWYNESTELVLERAPDLVVRTDRAEYTFPAEDSAMVKAGKYRDTNFYGAPLAACTYGDFLSSRTSYILLRYRVSGMEKGEKIEEIRLDLRGCTLPEEDGKRMIIIKEFSSTWDSRTIKFSDLLYGVYSFNGLYDADKWSKPPYADMEYLWQASRFPYYKRIIDKYEKYGDEELLYRLQRNLYDAVVRFGDFKSSNSRYTYDEDGIRGGYTRTLDASGKLGMWTVCLDYLAKSKYRDAEFFTAYLKHIHDTMNYLLTNSSRGMGNWTEFIFRGILNSASVMPELKREFNGKDWLADCIEMYEKTARGCIFPDGSYMEGNSGYAQTALENYIMVKEKVEQLGEKFSDYYSDIVRKNAHYCANLFTANGESLQYGDCINYPREFYNDWDKICAITGDEELKYLVSYGTEGKRPASTMYHSEDSRLTVMRSDFDKDAVYLFTDVRGGGGHSHCDENSVIVAAYGKTLLRDSGVFSYTPEDPYRVWGISTRSHNTVEIDGKNQLKYDFVHEVPGGKIHELSDDEKISRVSQSSYAYPEAEHKRTIIFVKPDIFVICDDMLPLDGEKHSYDVLWHFNVNEEAEISGSVCCTKSDGANIRIINLTGEEISAETGWIDLSYGQIEEAKYLSQHTQSEGNCRIVNVLLPEKPGEKREVSAELCGGYVNIIEKGNKISIKL